MIYVKSFVTLKYQSQNVSTLSDDSEAERLLSLYMRRQCHLASPSLTHPPPHQVTTGTTSLTPRWDKCVNYVENSLVYATGRLFVNTHFQEDKKHMVGVLLENDIMS